MRFYSSQLALELRAGGLRGGHAHAHARLLLLALCALVSAGCRDYKRDPGYCGTCAADASAVEALPSAGDGTANWGGRLASGQAGYTAAVSGGGIGADTAGVGAVSGRTGQAAAGSVDTKIDAGPQAQAGTGGTGGTPEQDAGGKPVPMAGAGSGGAGAGTGAGAGAGAAGMKGVAGMQGTAGKPVVEPVPCGTTCPSEIPVCTQRGCVECTPASSNKCRGTDTPVCDPFEYRCIGCTKVPNSCSDRNKPVCNEQSQTCVACTALEADLCQSKDQVCLDQGDKHECVECLDNAQCGDAARAHCDPQSHTCAGCATDLDCQRFADTPVCDTMSTKACVHCKGPGRDRCKEGETCEHNVCVNTPPTPGQATELCAACSATTPCADGAGKCSVGNFCLPQARNDGHCNPTGLYTFAVPSLADPTAMLCGPDLTKVPTADCNAIAKFGDACSDRCSDTTALCLPTTKKCTYACTTRDQCPPGYDCLALTNTPCTDPFGCAKYCQVN